MSDKATSEVGMSGEWETDIVHNGDVAWYRAYESDDGYYIRGADDPYKIVKRKGKIAIINWMRHKVVVAEGFDSLEAAKTAYLLLL